jgi:tight adherence protein B
LLLLIAISTLIVKGDRPTSVRARVSAFLPGEADPRLPTTLVDDESNRRISPLLRWLQRLLEGARWWERFREEVEIAQFDRSPIEIALLAMAGSVVGAVIIYAITGSVIPGILTLLAGPVVVRLFVRYRLRRQQRLFAEQLGEHLQEVAATMRAGRSLTDALVMVTEAASEPTHREFELALADERLGMPLDQALLPIGTRMANKDMAQFALVAALDRRTGASTAEVVDRIADGVRENAELRRELRALTAQVSLSRWILSLLPVGVLLLISITDPSYEAPMYHTAFGVVLLILCGLMVIAGSFVMTRLVKVDF